MDSCVPIDLSAANKLRCALVPLESYRFCSDIARSHTWVIVFRLCHVETAIERNDWLCLCACGEKAIMPAFIYHEMGPKMTCNSKIYMNLHSGIRMLPSSMPGENKRAMFIVALADSAVCGGFCLPFFREYVFSANGVIYIRWPRPGPQKPNEHRLLTFSSSVHRPKPDELDCMIGDGKATRDERNDLKTHLPPVIVGSFSLQLSKSVFCFNAGFSYCTKQFESQSVFCLYIVGGSRSNGNQNATHQAPAEWTGNISDMEKRKLRFILCKCSTVTLRRKVDCAAASTSAMYFVVGTDSLAGCPPHTANENEQLNLVYYYYCNIFKFSNVLPDVFSASIHSGLLYRCDVMREKRYRAFGKVLPSDATLAYALS